MSHARVNIAIVFQTWDRFVQGRDAFIEAHRAKLIERYTAPRTFLGFKLKPRTREQAEKLLRSHDVIGYLDAPWNYRGEFSYAAEHHLSRLYGLAKLAEANGFNGRKFIYLSTNDAELIHRFNPQEE